VGDTVGEAQYRVWAVTMDASVGSMFDGSVRVVALCVEDAIATAKRIVTAAIEREGRPTFVFEVMRAECQPYGVVMGDAVRQAVRNE
jgi:tRNA A37 threonylcarbamoyltransferase TsaD